MGPNGEKRLVRRYVSLEMERRYPSNNQSRGRRGARTSSVPMAMRTGANSTPLGPPQQEEEEVMTDFFQILQPTRISRHNQLPNNFLYGLHSPVVAYLPVTHSILGSNIIFLGVLYHMMESLSHRRPAFESRTCIFVRMKEKQ
jgi:hypothetical protein